MSERAERLTDARPDWRAWVPRDWRAPDPTDEREHRL